MPALPPRLSLEQVRRLAKDLLRDLKDGDRAAPATPTVGSATCAGRSSCWRTASTPRVWPW
jgi:hypothetical protein